MDLKMVFLASLTIWMITTLATARVCYECINAGSDEECMLDGTIKTCKDNQETCETVVRYKNRQIMITKLCKQKKACLNNLLQNPAVCNPKHPNAFCYCCCHDDMCNDNSDQCWLSEQPEIVPVEKPILLDTMPTQTKCGQMEDSSIEFPEMICTNGESPGSVCAINHAEKIPMEPPVRRRCVKQPDGMYLWQDVELAELESEGFVCPEIYEPTENSVVTCSDGNSIGSRCLFECDEGYVVDSGSPMLILTPGQSLSVCESSGEGGLILKWSGEAPICKPIMCDAPPMSEDDVISRWCSDGNRLGSSCVSMCPSGFGVTPTESSTVTCFDEDGDGVAQWDREFPRCEPLSCDPFTVPDAIVTCSENFEVNSTCEVTCRDDSHVLFPSTFDEVTCRVNQTWSSEPPCCRKPCPPHAPMDMVIAMDSSSSITSRSWFKMRAFVKRLVKYFFIGPESTNFAIFRYNNKPDEDSQIQLDNGNDQTSMESAIDRIPHDGKGTWTGLALHFAADVAFHPSNGQRNNTPDIMLVITDGQNHRFDDNVPDAVKKLQAMDVTVLVVAVEPEKLGATFKFDHLVNVAGGIERNVFLPVGGSLDVIDDIRRVVIEKVCDNICDLNL